MLWTRCRADCSSQLAGELREIEPPRLDNHPAEKRESPGQVLLQRDYFVDRCPLGARLRIGAAWLPAGVVIRSLQDPRTILFERRCQSGIKRREEAHPT